MNIGNIFRSIGSETFYLFHSASDIPIHKCKKKTVIQWYLTSVKRNTLVFHLVLYASSSAAFEILHFCVLSKQLLQLQKELVVCHLSAFNC